MGRFMVRTQEGYVLYVCTKFEADSWDEQLGHVTQCLKFGTPYNV